MHNPTFTLPCSALTSLTIIGINENTKDYHTPMTVLQSLYKYFQEVTELWKVGYYTIGKPSCQS